MSRGGKKYGEKGLNRGEKGERGENKNNIHSLRNKEYKTGQIHHKIFEFIKIS